MVGGGGGLTCTKLDVIQQCVQLVTLCTNSCLLLWIQWGGTIQCLRHFHVSYCTGDVYICFIYAFLFGASELTGHCETPIYMYSL